MNATSSSLLIAKKSSIDRHILAGIGKKMEKEHSHAVPSTELVCKLIGAESSLRGAAILHNVSLLAVLEAVALQEILTRHAAGYLGDAIFADFVSTGTRNL